MALESCGPNSGDFCGLGGAVVGTGLGMIAATSLDASWARETAPVAGELPMARFVPQLQIGAGRVTFGVVGRL